MFLRERGDKLPLRMALVRDFLEAGTDGAFNPFVVSHNREELFIRTQMLANNAKSAIQELALIARRESASILPSMQIEVSELVTQGGDNPEQALINMFSTVVTEAYAAIGVLEKQEDSRQPLDGALVDVALSGMEGLRVIALETPRVYEVMKEKGIAPVFFN